MTHDDSDAELPGQWSVDNLIESVPLPVFSIRKERRLGPAQVGDVPLTFLIKGRPWWRAAAHGRRCR